MALPALGGIYVPVPSKFVRGWHLGSLKRDAFVSYLEYILAIGRRSIISVKEGLCPYLRNRMVQEAWAAISTREESIEGLDVGVDGQLESWVSSMIGGRIFEEVLAPEEAELMVPCRVSRTGGHSYWQ